MTVKPSIHSYIYTGLLFSIIVGVDCMFVLGFGEAGVWVAVILSVLMGMIAVPFAFCNCRTLHFSEKGCTVSCLGLRKFTPWDKLVIRQEECFKGAHTYPGGYGMKSAAAGAVFSTNKKMRPKRLGIGEFSFFRNPFTTFYVVYREENEKHIVSEPHIVDREAFLATLASFGIELVKRKF